MKNKIILFHTLMFLFVGIVFNPIASASVEGTVSSETILAQSLKGEDVISPYNITGESLVRLIKKMGDFDNVPGSNIIFNRKTAQLFIRQTPAGHNVIENILNNMRKVNYRQVEIEARIIRVSSTNIEDIGLDFLGLDALGKTNGAVIGTDSAFDGNYLTNIDFPNVQNSSSTSIGGQLAFAALSSDVDIVAYIDALKSKAVVNTLSAPKLIVANNQRANIKIEKSQFYIKSIDTDTNSSAIAVDPNVAVAQSGTILDVTPTINSDNTISLELHPVFATVDITNTQNIDLGDRVTSTLQPEVTLPVFTIQNADTTLTVENGGVAVIGGLIEEQETKSDYKVPVLGDIPVIGKYVFSSSQVQEEKSHLIIFVKAKVVDTRKSHLS